MTWQVADECSFYWVIYLGTALFSCGRKAGQSSRAKQLNDPPVCSPPYVPWARGEAQNWTGLGE